MEIRIALAGNPNSGKTTLFNALTGSNQFVGNWPGVTVEKKEGRLKGEKDVIITDLPGIYSLSPYTMEEVIARNVPTDQRPDALLNMFGAINDEGQTILMVTHSVKAASHAKRVLFLRDGEVFHQLYRGTQTSEQMFAHISDALTVIAQGGELDA